MSLYLSINRLKDNVFVDVTEELGYSSNLVGSNQLACLIDKFPTAMNLGDFLPEDCQEYFRPESKTFHDLLTAAMQDPAIQDVHLKMLLDVELDETLWFLYT